MIPYYQRFLDRFPTVEALAAASERKSWRCGAGWVTIRARATCCAPRGRWRRRARFPRDYAGLRALPGIGDYTAAAIASIAFQLPHAVVDGNVLRVVARMGTMPRISPRRARACASARSRRPGSIRAIPAFLTKPSWNWGRRLPAEESTLSRLPLGRRLPSPAPAARRPNCP